MSNLHCWRLKHPTAQEYGHAKNLSKTRSFKKQTDLFLSVNLQVWTFGNPASSLWSQSIHWSQWFHIFQRSTVWATLGDFHIKITYQNKMSYLSIFKENLACFFMVSQSQHIQGTANALHTWNRFQGKLMSGWGEKGHNWNPNYVLNERPGSIS